MKRFNPNQKRNYLSIFTPFIVLIIVLLTIGYSAFQNSGIISDITASVKPDMNIKITDLQINNTSDAIVVSKDYNSINNNNSTYTGKILGDLTFTKTTSSVTFKVEVTNFGNVEMGVSSISGLPSNLTYELDTTTYDIGEKLCDRTTTTKCTLGSKTDIYITIKYKSGSGTNTSTNLSLNLDLTFKEAHKIYYSGNIVDYVLDGGNKTVSLGSSAPDYIQISGTHSSHSYTKPNVTINGVTSDITIEEIHKIYLDNSELDTVVHGGNKTVSLGSNAPASDSNITITGTYVSKSYTNPNLTLNGVTSDIYITIQAPSGGKLSDKVLSLISNETPDSNGIYTPESGTGCTNKLIDDATEDHNIRFVGSNPCNYVTFNGETWRIIGVFNNVGSEPLVKIVNSTSAYSRSVKYNNGNANGKNKWGTNTLYTSMSSTSAATNNIVESVQWRISGPNNATNNTATFYSNEKNVLSTSVSIGLINASDFGYATDNISSCRNSNLGNWNVANCVTNHNWLDLDSGSNSFTLSTPGNANTVFRIQATHVIYTQTINTSSVARAVVYLKANVLYDSGDGSSGSPFTLKMN